MIVLIPHLLVASVFMLSYSVEPPTQDYITKRKTKKKSQSSIEIKMVVLILGDTLVSVVFKTQRELKCQNELFSTNHFSENTSVYVFVTKII